MAKPIDPAPLFSIVMPVYDTPETLLRPAIDSVLAQTCDDFELIVVNDGSTQPQVEGVLVEKARRDRRIRVIERESNGGIGVASQDGVTASRGTYLTFLDHDDLLAADALEVCRLYLDAHPDCDLLYTDEDWIDVGGHTLGPFLKPDWSPERVRAQNCVNHLAVYRRSLVDALGGIRSGFDGSQDYDLMLRVSEQAREIVHVPRILYHWRVRAGQVSGSGQPSVYAAARQAITDHLARTGVDGWVEQIDPQGIYRIHRHVTGEPLVSLVIPTRGSSGAVWGVERVFVVEAIRSILASSTYQNLEFVIVADAETPAEVVTSIVDLAKDRLRLVRYDQPFNYSLKVNLGVASATGRYVLLLNDDIEVITPDWIEILLGLAQQPDVGLVGCALIYEDGTLQHGGHHYLSATALGHIAHGVAGDDPGPVSALRMDRECSGVTAACALLRREDYLAVGGLSHHFPVNFNDVDFCLKIRTALGRRIVFTPFARLYHFESKSRREGVGFAENETIRGRWGHVLDHGDPYWRYPMKSKKAVNVIEPVDVPDRVATAIRTGR